MTAAFVLTVVALIGSVLLAIPIADPMGPFGSWSPLAWVHDARADHFLSKENPSLGDLSQAESESWVALSQAPVDDVAWTNLAYIDRLRNGKLTSRGLKWLQRSYDVAPFGPTVSPWRIRFALENWEALTPELRGEVIDESRAYGGRNPQRLEQIAHQIRDPAGRLAGTLLMSQLTLEKAKTP